MLYIRRCESATQGIGNNENSKILFFIFSFMDQQVTRSSIGMTLTTQQGNAKHNSCSWPIFLLTHHALRLDNIKRQHHFHTTFYISIIHL